MRSLSALLVLGTVLLAVCLYWNRIALGGPYGQAPRWVRELSFPADALHRAVAGPIPLDAPDSGQPHRVRQVVSSWTVASAAYLAAAWLVLRGGASSRVAIELIVALSIVFRIALVASPALLETDPRRYLWDGAVQAAGVNPYAHAPRDVLLFREGVSVPSDPARAGELRRLAALSRDPRLAEHFLLINHPTVPTIYPPTAQLVFSAAALLAPGDLQLLKLFIAAFDIGVVLLLLALLDRLGRPREWVLLYGWCPLALKEYAGTGHYDPVASAFLLASLLVVLRGRRLLAGVLGGLAVSAKLYPAVVLVVLWRRYGVRGALACGATVGLLYGPHLAGGAWGGTGLAAYASAWVGNASLFALAESAFSGLDRLLPGASPFWAGGSALAARLLMGVLLASGIALLASRPDGGEAAEMRKGYLAVALLFVVSPVQHPWYAGWVLPLATLQGSVAWPVLSVTMATYYAYFSTRSYLRALPWGAALDLRWLEYVPFYALLAAEREPGRPISS